MSGEPDEAIDRAREELSLISRFYEPEKWERAEARLNDLIVEAQARKGVEHGK